MQLKGKTAIVTGAARRVGRAIALALARKGANVVVHYLSSGAEAMKTVEEILRLGVEACAIQADISKGAEVKHLVEQSLAAFGRIDVLVNNAAIYKSTPFSTLTEEDWEEVIAINLKGPFLCSKMAADVMLRQGGGKVVNIADWSGLRPYLDYIPYCVSKAGVIALTKGLAKTLAPTIQVNCIAPGPILLPEWMSEEERQEVISQTPLRRIGSPEDIAAALLFLIEGSDFITGALLTVDGGRLIA